MIYPHLTKKYGVAPSVVVKYFQIYEGENCGKEGISEGEDKEKMSGDGRKKIDAVWKKFWKIKIDNKEQ